MKKSKNLEIEFLRFIFCIMVILQHSQYVTKDFPDSLRFTAAGHKAIYFFFAVSGFLMVTSYFKNNTFGVSCEKAAWKFSLNKMKPIYPDFLFAVLINLALTLGAAFVAGTLDMAKFAQYISEVFPDVIGVSGAGMKSFHLGVAWYLGAMFVILPIFYYMLCKNNKFFLYFFAPVAFPFLLAIRYRLSTSSDSTIKVINSMIESPLKAAIGLLVGVLAYLVCERIKKCDFTPFGKFVLTSVEIIGYAFIIYSSVFTTKVVNTYLVPVFIFTTAITFSEKSAVINLFRKGRLFSFLGKASLPLYLNHTSVFYVVVRLFPKASYFHNMMISIPFIILLSAFEYFGVRLIMLLWKKSGIRLIKKRNEDNSTGTAQT